MSVNPLTSTLAALLESAANAALAANPGTRAKFAELDGQILLLELTTLNGAPALAIRINSLAADGGSLSVMADTQHNTRAPHAIVRGSATDVLASLFRDDLPANISIDGDERLLMALKHSFASLQPHWRERVEELVTRFSNLTGAGSSPVFQDVLGQAELAFDTLRNSLGDLLGNTRDSARARGDYNNSSYNSGSYNSNSRNESANHRTQNNDLDEFATRLENLQLSVDRLQAQVDQVANSRQPPETTPKKLS